MGLFNSAVFDKNIVWTITILGSIIALSRMFIHGHKIQHPHESMRHLSEHIHYIPDNWERDADKHYIYTKFTTLFVYRIVTLLKEIIGILITPYLLWFKMPKYTEEIIFFFKECTLKDKNLGYVCEFALFDTQQVENIETSILNDRHKTKAKKMEKSFINFKTENPEWGNNIQCPLNPELLQSIHDNMATTV